VHAGASEKGQGEAPTVTTVYFLVKQRFDGDQTWGTQKWMRDFRPN
jgi:hypothetical protein